jgi:bacillolysin
MRSSVEWNDWCQYFIDFNQDGDFLDAGEFVHSHGQTGGALVNGAAYQIPVTALNGNTIMRCRSLWINTANPCAGATFGETEDYTITITCATSGPAPEVATHCQITNVTTTSFTYRCNLLSGLAINPSINFELLKNE